MGRHTARSIHPAVPIREWSGAVYRQRKRQVVGADDDIASRWGPRVVEFLRAIAPHVKQLELQAA